MIINLLNEYYKSRSIDQNNADLVNMYLEIENKDVLQQNIKGGLTTAHPKYKIIAYPSPGKTVFNSGSGSVVRGMIENRGVLYAVIDNTLYSYDSAGTRTSRGTLSTSTGQVEISAIPGQLEIIDGTSIYNYNTGTTAFTTVSDPDAPSNPLTMATQDSTVLISSNNAVTIYGSDIADGTSWSALSFGSKTTTSDYIVKLQAFKSRIWIFGTYESEIWYNNGASTFSFAIVQGSSFPYGCAAKNSVAHGQDAIYLLAQSKKGGLTILSANESGMIPTPNQGIIKQINDLVNAGTTISDAVGYCYMKNGHEFYILNFPTAGVSFEYDITSDVWSSRMSYVSAAYTRDLGNCYAYCYGKHLVGAYNSGTIYYLDDTVYTENSTVMLKCIVTPPAYAEGKKLFFDRLQVDTEKGVGSNKSLTTSISYDSGHTYTDTYTDNLPDVGERLFWNRLGMTQDAFVVKLESTADAKFIVLGAIAEVHVGNN